MRALAGGAAVTAVVAVSLVTGVAAPAQTLPDVRVPQLQAPSVDLPALPRTPDLPSVPSVTSPPSAPSAGGIGSEVGGVTGAVGAGNGAGAVSGGGSGAATGSFQGGTGQQGAGVSPSGGDGSAAAERAKRRTARDARLRRSVTRLRGCLAAIPPFQRRVLALRAGLSGGRPSSRVVTAQRLRTSLLRIAGAEARGVRRLRRAARTRGCVREESVGEAVVASALGLAIGSVGGPGAGIETAADGAGQDQNAVLGVARASAEDGAAGDDDEVVLGAPEGGIDGAAASDESGPTLVLWLVALALMATAALVLLRRRLHHGGGTTSLPAARSPAPWAERDD